MFLQAYSIVWPNVFTDSLRQWYHFLVRSESPIGEVKRKAITGRIEPVVEL